MKKSILILFAGLLCANQIKAQVEGALGYYNDALLFSQTYTAGTARMQAIGGAQVSLGGDVSAAHVNPAGLGFFRRSAVTFTPSLDFNTSEAEYFGRFTEDFNTNFNFGQLGFVFNYPHNNENSDFKSGSLAITFTRTNNFYSNTYIDADANESIVDSYLDRSFGVDFLDEFSDLGLAEEQGILFPVYEPDPVTGEDIPAFDSPVLGVPRQVERIKTRGKQNQWDFAYGGNYMDKLYFGIGLGISSIDYSQTSTYTESDFIDDELDLSSLDTVLVSLSTQNILDLEGYGWNATFGMIARPADWVRIGLTAKTPTWYSIRETGSFDLLTEFSQLGAIDEGYGIIDFTDDYKIQTPWKLSLGSSFFFGKNGFISADLDYIDYSSSRVRSNLTQFEENESIRLLYKPTVNFRVGGEYRIGVMRLRAGYGRQGDPYEDGDINSSIQRISGGLGYRNENIFIDASVVHSSYESLRSPYVYYDGTGPTAELKNKNVNVSLTLGFNF